MNRKLHRELIKEASRYHFWHNWHYITKGGIGYKADEKIITLKETPYGKLTAGLRRRRCMGCGKEEYIEIGGGYSKFDRHWTPKPTAEDTAQELFGIPPHSDATDCECGCQDGSIDDDSGRPPRPDVPPAPPQTEHPAPGES